MSILNGNGMQKMCNVYLLSNNKDAQTVYIVI